MSSTARWFSILPMAMSVTATADDTRQAHWISDLTRCEPADAIAADGAPGTWLTAEYEVGEGRGVMLFARPDANAPPLTLKLNLTGWYQIRLGIFYGSDDNYLCAKLNTDPAYSRFGREKFSAPKDGNYPEKAMGPDDLCEVFWKSADLTGTDLMFAHPPRGTMAEANSNIAYVRLLPMDEAAVSQWQAEQPSEKTKRLIANYDGGSFSQWAMTNKEDFLAEFECLRESDFDIALYAVAAGPITRYPSKVGELINRHRGLHQQGPIVHKLIENGIDPLAEAIEAAHACGVKLFPQNRFGGSSPPPRHVRADIGGQFMADNPQWMALCADGEPTRHLSFAFAGVRDFYVRMLREWVEDYHADGINLLFSRSYPFVYYEQPVCDAFQKQYGQDMRQLPASDTRVQRVRAEFLTGFLRQVRAMLDEVGKDQGRHIPTCYLVPVHNSPEGGGDATNTALGESLFNALDVPTWVRDGLVDHLVVHLHMYGEHDGRGVQPKIREFTELSQGTKTKVYVDIYPRRMPPRQYRKIAISYYGAGADGLALWDSFGRYYRASEWAFIKRLGHRDDLEGWEGKGDGYSRKFPLIWLDGFLVGHEYFTQSDG